MMSPRAARGRAATEAFHPVLADPLGWAREVTVGLVLACVAAVASTVLTLGLTSLGLPENPALITAFCLSLTVIVTLMSGLRHFRQSRSRDRASTVGAIRASEESLG
jgi:Kef-type K+ transport system membrane component KefB